MDKDNPGASHGGFLSKLYELQTPRSINQHNEQSHISYEKISYPWVEIIFPLTLMVISLISIVLISIILIFWLKQNSKTQIKMNQDLEENSLVRDEHTEDSLMNFKDKLDECNELQNFSDENHSPNIDKNSKSTRMPGQSPKCFKPDQDSKKQWILHSAPPLDLKHDVSVQPKSPKGLNSPLKCTTPNIFKFEVKSVPPDSFNRPDTNIFNFSVLNSPLSSNDSANYYTPKTSGSPELNPSLNLTSSNFYTPMSTSTHDTITSDSESKFNYSPKSCEYYSAKSTLKTPYEHFKFPEPESEFKTEQEITSPKDSNIPADNLNIENSTILHRRARLKSISLDSETASLVEAHLSVPMINLMKSHDNNNKLNIQSDMKKPRNLNSLTLNLDYKDESLSGNMNQEDIPKTPKTPTLTQTKQKAISLDSSDAFTPLITLPKQNHTQNSSISVPNTPKRFIKKVTHKPPHLVKSNYYAYNPDSLNMSNIGEHLPGSRSYNQKLTNYTRKMGSFDENIITELSQNKLLTRNKQDVLSTTNLLNKNTLSVSNHNLKTLPEISPLSDFKINSDCTKKSILQRRGSNQSLTLNLDSNFKSSYLSLQGSVSNLTNFKMLSASNYSLQAGSSYNIYDGKSTGKKCLLQRRGSNNSLTLNLQKSNLNLNRFTSQSSLSINQSLARRGLLERRNSNTSLTLNLSQGLISGNTAGMVMSNTDNNPETTTNNSTTTRVTSPVHKSTHHKIHRNHRKSISTESLFENDTHDTHNDTMTPTHMSESMSGHSRLTFGSVDDITSNLTDTLQRKHCYRPIRNISTRPLSLFDTHNDTLTPTHMSESMSGHSRLTFGSVDDITSNLTDTLNRKHCYRPIRNITTRPLSPQANSEDFKTYLANLQILQNATNVLSRDQLRDLNMVFQQSYRGTSDNEINTDKLCDNNREASNIDKFFVTSKLNEDLKYEKKSLLLNLHKEFWNLPNNFQEKPIVFGSQGKNRYKSILPNEHSRVILDQKSESNKEGYINANYIKGYDNTSNSYIVTQGPLPNTIYDFWSMVHQNVNQTQSTRPSNRLTFTDTTRKPSQKIVMLTNLYESNHQKCAVYFPSDLGSSLEFTDDNSNRFIVKNIGVKFKQGYSLRKLLLRFVSRDDKLINENDLIVFHYWFDCWPDHKSPDDVNVLLDMALHILDSDCELDFTSYEQSEVMCDKDNLVNKTNEYCNKTLRDQSTLRFNELSEVKNDSGLRDSSNKTSDESNLINKTNDNCKSLRDEYMLNAIGVSDRVLDMEKTSVLRDQSTLGDFSDKLNRFNNDYGQSINVKNLSSENEIGKCDQTISDSLRDQSTSDLGQNIEDTESVKCVSKCFRDQDSHSSTNIKRIDEQSHNNTNTEDTKSLRDQDTHNLKTINRHTPLPIVHCSAGIGRTGCLVAILNGIQQYRNTQRVDILGIVCNMRLGRGGMVQNSEQYELVHRALCLLEGREGPTEMRE